MTDPQRGTTYVWRSKQQLPERFGQPCWIVPQPGIVSDFCMVEFEDGHQVLAPRMALKRA